MTGVFFVGAGPGDPDLITVRGLRILETADVLVYTGSLVNRELVNRSHAKLKLDSHGMRLGEIVDVMTRHARAGETVVRLHSGDPSLYGAIVEQMQALEAAGVTFQMVPGVSSMFAAAAALGIQLTLGGVADTVIVTRPAGATLKEDEIEALSHHKATLVIFLGTEYLEEVTAKVRCPPETPAAVVYHASWPDQIVLRGTVEDIAKKARDAGIERTALLVIGGVLDPEHQGHRRSVLYS